MIATSSGAITEDKARTYAHDVEILAKAGYLKSVDPFVRRKTSSRASGKLSAQARPAALSSPRSKIRAYPSLASAALQTVIVSMVSMK